MRIRISGDKTCCLFDAIHSNDGGSWSLPHLIRGDSHLNPVLWGKVKKKMSVNGKMRGKSKNRSGVRTIAPRVLPAGRALLSLLLVARRNVWVGFHKRGNTQEKTTTCGALRAVIQNKSHKWIQIESNICTVFIPRCIMGCHGNQASHWKEIQDFRPINDTLCVESCLTIFRCFTCAL